MHTLDYSQTYQLYVVYYVQSTDFEHNFAHVVATDGEDAKKLFSELTEFADFDVEKIEGAYPVTGRYKQGDTEFLVTATPVHKSK